MSKLVFKYIAIGESTEHELHAGKPLYWIVNNRSGNPLGQIFWYPSWRRWVARFKEDSVWSPDCLVDVNKAIEAITANDAAKGAKA